VSQLSGQIAAPGQGATSLLDGSSQGGAPGQSMKADQGSGGGPGQPMKGEQGAAGGPGHSMQADAGASGGPGQATKNEGGAPGAAFASQVDGGTSGGPGQAPPGQEVQAGASGAPDAPKKDGPQIKEGERKEKPDAGTSGGPGASGKPGTAEGTSGAPGAAGGPGAKKADEEDDLVDPDADRPNFGTTPDDDEEAEDEDSEDEDEAVVGAASRKGARSGGKARSRPIDPAYVTVAVMGVAVLSLAGMLWLGRGIMMEMWPGISGFYKSMGAEAVKPGDGLRIAESSKRLQRIGGVETLVVRGFISNVSDVPKAVPNLSLQLYNDKREVIQDAGTPAPTGLLDPGASIEFEARLELPQLSAAKGGYGVVWAE
jgi:hypothetical protein